MPMSRIARTHLVYQFIILTLVFLGIGYYELLLERRFMMFLMIVPTFLYQLVILSCCTELIPMPRWISRSDSQDQSEENATNNMIELEKTTEENCKNETDKSALFPEPNHLSNINCEKKVCAKKYEFKNSKAFSPSPGNSVMHLSAASVMKNSLSPKPPKDFSFGYNNSDQIQSSEPTKSYFFPCRQKRLEQWIDSQENSRPYKIRNWQSHINDTEHDSIPATNSSEATLAEVANIFTGSSLPKCSVIPESELTKRYTFPLRQKREPLMVPDREIDDSSIMSSSPYWKSVGYSAAVKREAMRRSRSSSLLTRRPNNAGKLESERCKDFSVSVEIARVPNDSSRENSMKPASPVTTTFGKMKLGIVNCFSKIKKENVGNKKRTLKRIFQSRENVNSDLHDKEHKLKSKAKNETPCGFYPTYYSFQKGRFESDVQKSLSELPKER